MECPHCKVPVGDRSCTSCAICGKALRPKPTASSAATATTALKTSGVAPRPLPPVQASANYAPSSASVSAPLTLVPSRPASHLANVRPTTTLGFSSGVPIGAGAGASVGSAPPKARGYPSGYAHLDPLTRDTFVIPVSDRHSERPYQVEMAAGALFSNSIVCVPTGMGKTLIASIVMLNYYRWFPTGKIVFMAPSKPLVEQQLRAVSQAVGFSEEDTALLNGELNANKERKPIWQETGRGSKRVIFCTPQTFRNDLTSGLVDARKVVLLVIDEAHHANGSDSPYKRVVELLMQHNGGRFRVLALSATPGKEWSKVQNVVRHLCLSRILMRTHAELAQYVNQINVLTIDCPPSAAVKDYAAELVALAQPMRMALERSKHSKKVAVSNSKEGYSQLAASAILKGSKALNDQWRAAVASGDTAKLSELAPSRDRYALLIRLMVALKELLRVGTLELRALLKRMQEPVQRLKKAAQTVAQGDLWFPLVGSLDKPPIQRLMSAEDCCPPELAARFWTFDVERVEFERLRRQVERVKTGGSSSSSLPPPYGDEGASSVTAKLLMLLLVRMRQRFEANPSKVPPQLVPLVSSLPPVRAYSSSLIDLCLDERWLDLIRKLDVRHSEDRHRRSNTISNALGLSASASQDASLLAHHHDAGHAGVAADGALDGLSHMRRHGFKAAAAAVAPPMQDEGQAAVPSDHARARDLQPPKDAAGRFFDLLLSRCAQKNKRKAAAASSSSSSSATWQSSSSSSSSSSAANVAAADAASGHVWHPKLDQLSTVLQTFFTFDSNDQQASSSSKPNKPSKPKRVMVFTHCRQSVVDILTFLACAFGDQAVVDVDDAASLESGSLVRAAAFVGQARSKAATGAGGGDDSLPGYGDEDADAAMANLQKEEAEGRQLEQAQAEMGLAEQDVEPEEDEEDNGEGNVIDSAVHHDVGSTPSPLAPGRGAAISSGQKRRQLPGIRAITEGLNRGKQGRIVGAFDRGAINVLVATCIGEEGLDISEVGLIVLFDAITDPTRIVQRIGRTGRSGDGMCVSLATPSEKSSLDDAFRSYTRVCNLVQHQAHELEFYRNSPLMAWASHAGAQAWVNAEGGSEVDILEAANKDKDGAMQRTGGRAVITIEGYLAKRGLSMTGAHGPHSSSSSSSGVEDDRSPLLQPVAPLDSYFEDLRRRAGAGGAATDGPILSSAMSNERPGGYPPFPVLGPCTKIQGVTKEFTALLTRALAGNEGCHLQLPTSHLPDGAPLMNGPPGGTEPGSLIYLPRMVRQRIASKGGSAAVAPAVGASSSSSTAGMATGSSAALSSSSSFSAHDNSSSISASGVKALGAAFSAPSRAPAPVPAPAPPKPVQAAAPSAAPPKPQPHPPQPQQQAAGVSQQVSSSATQVAAVRPAPAAAGFPNAANKQQALAAATAHAASAVDDYYSESLAGLGNDDGDVIDSIRASQVLPNPNPSPATVVNYDQQRPLRGTAMAFNNNPDGETYDIYRVPASSLSSSPPVEMLEGDHNHDQDRFGRYGREYNSAGLDMYRYQQPKAKATGPAMAEAAPRPPQGPGIGQGGLGLSGGLGLGLGLMVNNKWARSAAAIASAAASSSSSASSSVVSSRGAASVPPKAAASSSFSSSSSSAAASAAASGVAGAHTRQAAVIKAPPPAIEPAAIVQPAQDSSSSSSPMQQQLVLFADHEDLLLSTSTSAAAASTSPASSQAMTLPIPLAAFDNKPPAAIAAKPARQSLAGSSCSSSASASSACSSASSASSSFPPTQVTKNPPLLQAQGAAVGSSNSDAADDHGGTVDADVAAAAAGFDDFFGAAQDHVGVDEQDDGEAVQEASKSKSKRQRLSEEGDYVERSAEADHDQVQVQLHAQDGDDEVAPPSPPADLKGLATAEASSLMMVTGKKRGRPAKAVAADDEGVVEILSSASQATKSKCKPQVEGDADADDDAMSSPPVVLPSRMRVLMMQKKAGAEGKTKTSSSSSSSSSSSDVQDSETEDDDEDDEEDEELQQALALSRLEQQGGGQPEAGRSSKRSSKAGASVGKYFESEAVGEKNNRNKRKGKPESRRQPGIGDAVSDEAGISASQESGNREDADGRHDRHGKRYESDEDTDEGSDSDEDSEGGSSSSAYESSFVESSGNIAFSTSASEAGSPSSSNPSSSSDSSPSSSSDEDDGKEPAPKRRRLVKAADKAKKDKDAQRREKEKEKRRRKRSRGDEDDERNPHQPKSYHFQSLFTQLAPPEEEGNDKDVDGNNDDEGSGKKNKKHRTGKTAARRAKAIREMAARGPHTRAAGSSGIGRIGSKVKSGGLLSNLMRALEEGKEIVADSDEPSIGSSIEDESTDDDENDENNDGDDSEGAGGIAYAGPFHKAVGYIPPPPPPPRPVPTAAAQQPPRPVPAINGPHCPIGPSSSSSSSSSSSASSSNAPRPRAPPAAMQALPVVDVPARVAVAGASSAPSALGSSSATSTRARVQPAPAPAPKPAAGPALQTNHWQPHQQQQQQRAPAAAPPAFQRQPQPVPAVAPASVQSAVTLPKPSLQSAAIAPSKPPIAAPVVAAAAAPNPQPQPKLDDDYYRRLLEEEDDDDDDYLALIAPAPAAPAPAVGLPAPATNINSASASATACMDEEDKLIWAMQDETAREAQKHTVPAAAIASAPARPPPAPAVASSARAPVLLQPQPLSRPQSVASSMQRPAPPAASTSFGTTASSSSSVAPARVVPADAPLAGSHKPLQPAAAPKVVSAVGQGQANLTATKAPSLPLPRAMPQRSLEQYDASLLAGFLDDDDDNSHARPSAVAGSAVGSVARQPLAARRPAAVQAAMQPTATKLPAPAPAPRPAPASSALLAYDPTLLHFLE